MKFLRHALLLIFLLALAGTQPVRALLRDGNFVLVIDPGHGGRDAGAVGSFSKEKDINLNVALELGRLVEANNPDVKVIFTRRTDVFIPLQERAAIANRKKADLFISIHTNSLPAGRLAYGAETYALGMARASANLEVAKRENGVILLESDYQRKYQGFDPNKAESYVIFEFMQDKNMKQSVDLASAIQRHYVSSGRNNKGVHQAGFLVLRETTMPSVLTELGFISTPEEEQYLNSREGIQTLARSIYNGFVTYKNSVDKRGGQAELIPAEEPFSPPSDEPQRRSDGAREEEQPSAPLVPAMTRNERRAETQTERPARKKTTPAPVPKKDNGKEQAKKAEAKKADAAAKTANKNVKTSAKSAKKADEASSKTAVAAPKSKTAKEKTAGKEEKVEFRVYLFDVSKKLAKGDERLKGFAPNFYREGAQYVYTYGSTSDYNKAKSLLAEAKKKFPTCHVVALRGGKRIPLAEGRAATQKK